MNREKYIEYRKLNLIGEVAYAYYLEQPVQHCTEEEFKKYFVPFAVAVKQDKTKFIDWSLLWKHYDEKFDVRILTDTKNNNKIIKIF